LGLLLTVAGGNPLDSAEGFSVPAHLRDPARIAAVLCFAAVLLWSSRAFTAPGLARWRDELLVAVPLAGGFTYCAVATLWWGIQGHSWVSVVWGVAFTATPFMAGWVAAACALVFAVRTRRTGARPKNPHGSSGSGLRRGAGSPHGDEA
jgi:hypothetical protein